MNKKRNDERLTLVMDQALRQAVEKRQAQLAQAGLRVSLSGVAVQVLRATLQQQATA